MLSRRDAFYCSDGFDLNECRELGPSLSAVDLIDGATEVQEQWLDGVSTIGITSGASAPEELVERLVAFLQERGAPEPEDFEVLREDVRFMLPKEIRKGLAAAADR